VAEKTIDDVTRDEWAALVEAAVDLLAMARFMFWRDGHDHDEDRSYRDALEKMEAALYGIGLDQGTTPAFITRLEQILRENKPPVDREERPPRCSACGYFHAASESCTPVH
jgi:hypothetical protein